MRNSLPPELHEKIREALRQEVANLPDPRGGDAWQAGFRLARAVQYEIVSRGHDLAEIDPEEIVDEYFDELDIDSDYDAIEDDFIEDWHKVKHPVSPLHSAYKYAISAKNTEVVPPGLFRTPGRDERARIIMGMAAYLQRDHALGRFSLPIENVAELLDTTRMKISRIIRKLESEGILLCKEKAVAHRRARQFEYRRATTEKKAVT